jgi:hypothetical protein
VGIPPEQITDAMLELDGSGELRKLRSVAAGHSNAALTQVEASAKAQRKLEREEQRMLANWLRIQEEAGILVYDWSRTDRRATNRRGMPDFRIYRQGRALFGEMKLDGAKLSCDQIDMHDKFMRAGTEVKVWSSADVAIRIVRWWLWEHWRLWNEGEPGE